LAARKLLIDRLIARKLLMSMTFARRDFRARDVRGEETFARIPPDDSESRNCRFLLSALWA